MKYKNQQPSKHRKDKLNTYAKFSGLGIQMFAIIAAGTYLGVKLDERFTNKHNLYTVGFALCAVILSMVYVIRRIISNTKNN